jgi:hypothetical protein
MNCHKHPQVCKGEKKSGAQGSFVCVAINNAPDKFQVIISTDKEGKNNALKTGRQGFLRAAFASP